MADRTPSTPLWRKVAYYGTLGRDPTWWIPTFKPGEPLSESHLPRIRDEILSTIAAYELPALGPQTKFFPSDNDTFQAEYDPKKKNLAGYSRKSGETAGDICGNGINRLSPDFVQLYGMVHEAGHHVTMQDQALLERMKKIWDKEQPNVWKNIYMASSKDKDGGDPPQKAHGIDKDFFRHIREVAADLTFQIYAKNKYPADNDLIKSLDAYGHLVNSRSTTLYPSHDSSVLMSALNRDPDKKYAPGQSINIYQAAGLALDIMEKNSSRLVDNYNSARMMYGMHAERKETDDINSGQDSTATNRPTTTIGLAVEKHNSANSSLKTYCTPDAEDKAKPKQSDRIASNNASPGQ